MGTGATVTGCVRVPKLPGLSPLGVVTLLYSSGFPGLIILRREIRMTVASHGLGPPGTLLH